MAESISTTEIDWEQVAPTPSGSNSSYEFVVPDTNTGRAIVLKIIEKNFPFMASEAEERFKKPELIDDMRLDSVDISYKEREIKSENDPNKGKIGIDVYLRNYANDPDWQAKLRNIIQSVVPTNAISTSQ